MKGRLEANPSNLQFVFRIKMNQAAIKGGVISFLDHKPFLFLNAAETEN
jgi:hypothetical protein